MNSNAELHTRPRASMCSIARLVVINMLCCLASEAPSTAQAEAITGPAVQGSQSEQGKPPGQSESSTHSAAGISALIQRPASAPDLIENLRVAWEGRLLVQPAFFEDANLLKFFNGTSVTWKDLHVRTKSNFVASATVKLDDRVFPGSTVTVFRTHEVVPPVHAANDRNRGYVHDSGAIQMQVDSLQGFTWQAVKRAFGPDAKDVGVMANLHAMRTGPLPGKAYMRYLHVGEEALKLSAAERPTADFLLIQGPDSQAAAAPWSSAAHTPLDSDKVKSLRIFESVRR
jgi:hypothetical protein